MCMHERHTSFKGTFGERASDSKELDSKSALFVKISIKSFYHISGRGTNNTKFNSTRRYRDSDVYISLVFNRKRIHMKFLLLRRTSSLCFKFICVWICVWAIKELYSVKPSGLWWLRCLSGARYYNILIYRDHKHYTTSLVNFLLFSIILTNTYCAWVLYFLFSLCLTAGQFSVILKS